MKTLEKGQDKIKKICELLRDETLEPAQKEAQDIIKKAHKEAEGIVNEAKKAAQKLHEEARSSLEQEHNVFQASLYQATKQCLEALRQTIENKFFKEHLLTVITKNASEPQLIADLIHAIIDALKKEGLAANITALIPNKIEPRRVNELLVEDALKALKNQSVIVGNFSGGIKVRLDEKRMELDISEEALRELLSNYVVRKDFRKMIFEC